MKATKATKKLVINKATISNLSRIEMGNAQGGTEYTQEGICNTRMTCIRWCCYTYECPKDSSLCYTVYYCTE